MGFGSLGWTSRLAQLGDTAEAAFEDYAKQHIISYDRYGFNRPPLTKFHYLNEFIRNTPDYVAQWNKKLFFVECKGTAHNHVKLKPDQLTVLSEWAGYEPLIIFIYNSKTRQVSWMTLKEALTLGSTLPVKTFSSDNKAYWEIPVEWNRTIAQVL